MKLWKINQINLTKPQLLPSFWQSLTPTLVHLGLSNYQFPASCSLASVLHLPLLQLTWMTHPLTIPVNSPNSLSLLLQSLMSLLPLFSWQLPWEAPHFPFWILESKRLPLVRSRKLNLPFWLFTWTLRQILVQCQTLSILLQFPDWDQKFLFQHHLSSLLQRCNQMGSGLYHF